MSNQKNYSALQNVLPMMAGDIRVMKINMVKLVNLQSGTSRDKAKNFFDREAQKESLLESKMGKMGGTSPTRSSGSSGSGGGGTKLFSIADFIKNIANMLIKGALVALGTFGLAKLLQSDDVRKTIKDFISKMFFTVLEVIQKGAGLLTEFFKENGPEIREAIVKTFQAVVKLLVTAIESTANLLSDKRVWEGLWEIIQAIYAGIKKVLSTKINVAGEEVSLGVIVGAVIIAFGALKGAVWLLKMAADKAAASLFNIGGKSGVPTGAPTGNAPSGGSPSGGPMSKQERTRAGKEALDRIEQERLAQEAADLKKAGLIASGVVTAVAVGGTALTATAANTLASRSKEELDILANSGGGDDTALAAAILSESKTPTKTAAKPAPPKSDTSKPLTPTQIGGVQSEAKKFLGKNSADYLAAKEGFSAVAYLDPPGNTKNQYSIGHGHLIQSHEVAQGYILLSDGKKIPVSGVGGKDTKITKEQAKLLLQSDLPKYEKLAADPLGPEAWAKLSDDQKTALISYAYNTGSTASLVKAGLKDAILKGDMDKAADIISSKGIKTAGGKFHSGLEARRMSESTLFAGGQFPNPSGTESPTMLAKNETEAQDDGKSKTLIESMFDQLALFDEKILGGKLGISSVEMQNALTGIGKEFMNNPTFIDNSNNVSSTNMPPALASAVGASTWDREIANYYVDRVTYLE